MSKSRKPIKHRVSKLARIAQSKNDKRTQQLNLEAQKEYELEMTFCVQDVQKKIEKFVQEYNWGDAYIPECVVIPIYDYQDLILALKLRLLNTPTYWEIEASSNFYDAKHDKVLSIPFYIELPEMTHAEMMAGCKLKINRGHGLKTNWKGLGRELESHVREQQVDDNYIFVNNIVGIKVQATFKSVYAYMDFQNLLLLRDYGKLDEFLQDYQLREHGELKPKPINDSGLEVAHGGA